jgi:hypothetical protein
MNSIHLNSFQKKWVWNHLSNQRFPISSYIYSNNYGFYQTQLNQPYSIQNMQMQQQFNRYQIHNQSLPMNYNSAYFPNNVQ